MAPGHYRDCTNYWTLNFENLPHFFKIDFARAVLDAVCMFLGLSKASIIYLYQRIFERPSRLQRVLVGKQAYNAPLALSYVVSAFFVARPFGCDFVLDEAPAGGCTRHDVCDGSGAYSAVNAALDAWLVAVPAVVAWRLQMRPESWKINAIAMFATGVV